MSRRRPRSGSGSGGRTLSAPSPRPGTAPPKRLSTRRGIWPAAWIGKSCGSTGISSPPISIKCAKDRPSCGRRTTMTRRQKRQISPWIPCLPPSRTPRNTTRTTKRPRRRRKCSPSSWKKTAGSWTIWTASCK